MKLGLTCDRGLPVPLAVLILGRDVALSISAFYFRYISLPEPVSVNGLLIRCTTESHFAILQKTFKRYWDFSIPSAEVKPTQISKVQLSSQTTICLACL